MNELISIWSDYVHRYLINLIENEEIFEYYWMNRSHPECVIDDMSDYEIAYRYPLSGERLILDCWAAVNEHVPLDDKDWNTFILFVDSYINDCIGRIKVIKDKGEK